VEKKTYLRTCPRTRSRVSDIDYKHHSRLLLGEAARVFTRNKNEPKII